jgi:hypothetical protein
MDSRGLGLCTNGKSMEGTFEGGGGDTLVRVPEECRRLHYDLHRLFDDEQLKHIPSQ